MLKKIKLTYQVYNFFQKKKLTHNIPKLKQLGIGKKYYASICAKDFENIPFQHNIHDVKDSKQELPKQAKFQKLSSDIQESIKSWSENGYVVLKNYFSEQQIDEANDEVDKLLKTGDLNFVNGNKIMFSIHKSKLLKNIGWHPKIQNILELLLGKEIWLFQSLNFITGSQQGAHSDAISMTTFPHGNLIAIWVALEDTTMENGPLFYYPNSHRLPYVMNSDFDNNSSKFFLGKKSYQDYLNKIQDNINKHKLEKKYFLAKKGDVLIWHHNLIHGGEKVTNPKLTRKSMVFHYYAKDAVCYHEISERPTLYKAL